MFNTKLFAERLKAARTQKHISQAELAKSVGVSAATISSYETPSGAKVPSLDKAAAIASELDISLDWLCGKESAGKVKITDFDAETYLRALAVVISEMSTEFKTINDFHAMTFDNYELNEYITQVQDVLRVYHNGTLSTDLFEACVERIISNYDGYKVFGSRFLSEYELSAAYSSLSEKVHKYGLSSIKQGTIPVSLCLDPTISAGFDIFISEKTLEECKTFEENEQGGD